MSSSYTLIVNYQRAMFEAVKTNGLDPEDPKIKSAINNGLNSICLWAQRATDDVRNAIAVLDSLADGEDTIEAECVEILTAALQELSGEATLTLTRMDGEDMMPVEDGNGPRPTK